MYGPKLRSLQKNQNLLTFSINFISNDFLDATCKLFCSFAITSINETALLITFFCEN